MKITVKKAHQADQPARKEIVFREVEQVRFMPWTNSVDYQPMISLSWNGGDVESVALDDDDYVLVEKQA